jgi:pentatricopeptide repeat protein
MGEIGELFSEMLTQGIHSNATFFTTVMRNFCNGGLVTEAQSFLDLMVHSPWFCTESLSRAQEQMLKDRLNRL